MKFSRSFLSRALLALCAVVIASPLAHAKKQTPDEERAAIHKMRDVVLAELYKVHPAAEAKIKKAAGYAVFSNVGVNLVFASFAGGHGIAVEKGRIKNTETYMKMGSAGIGIGLGVKDFRAVFVFDSKEKLQNFVNKGWDFSGQADAAAKSDDKGGAAGGAGNIAPGVEVFQLTKNGLAIQATLQGTKYWKDKDLN
jgi:lipid-binding SYLF domain-containing protein